MGKYHWWLNNVYIDVNIKQNKETDEDWAKLQLHWHKFRQCLRTGSIRLDILTTEEEESRKQDCNHYQNFQSTIKAILKLTTGTVFSMQKTHSSINPSKIKQWRKTYSVWIVIITSSKTLYILYMTLQQ